VGVERVTPVEPDLVRVARVGLAGAAAVERGPVAWSATHGARRDESALFFTGDENLVELTGVVEYRLTTQGVADLIFRVAALDASVSAAAEGAFREAVGRSTLEAILAEGRRGFETDVETRLRERLRATGLVVAVDRVRVLDAHPPREVVPAYRDVSAAVSDAARYRNEAEAYAAEQRWSSIAEARARRDEAAALAHRHQSRAEGDRQAFLARVLTHSARPDLTEFRLLHDTMATAYAGRPKLILDPRAGGRRHVWLADPERLGLVKDVPAVVEPED
jgi:regulator of protease activity HflC (stomatin/prohibitin superfamily)